MWTVKLRIYKSVNTYWKLNFELFDVKFSTIFINNV
jgi:hypothetical protein